MRVLIIQNEENLRRNYALCLNQDPDIEVIGSYSSGEGAMDALENFNPDVLLVDLYLPGITGLDVIKKTKARIPDVDILAQIRFSDLENVIDAIIAGASSFIVAWASQNELVEALHNLQRGIVTIDPQLARAIIGKFQNGNEDKKGVLSGKEEAVLQLAASGCTTKQIAGDLDISSQCVNQGIRKVFQKLRQKYQGECCKNENIP